MAPSKSQPVSPAFVWIVANAVAGEFRALVVGIRDVVEKPGRDLRHAVRESGVKTATDDRFHIQIGAAAEHFDAAVQDRFRLGDVLGRRFGDGAVCAMAAEWQTQSSRTANKDIPQPEKAKDRKC